jgi:hypothetical protein
MTCRAGACPLTAVRTVRGWWLCSSHADLYDAHYRILDRILAIPPRP